MPSLTTSQIWLQVGIRVTVLIMLAGILYFYLFKPPAVVEPKQYLGDPRTACAFPADAKVTPIAVKYGNDTGTPTAWDEIPDEKDVDKLGYQRCK